MKKNTCESCTHADPIFVENHPGIYLCKLYDRQLHESYDNECRVYYPKSYFVQRICGNCKEFDSSKSPVKTGTEDWGFCNRIQLYRQTDSQESEKRRLEDNHKADSGCSWKTIKELSQNEKAELIKDNDAKRQLWKKIRNEVMSELHEV